MSRQAYGIHHSDGQSHWVFAIAQGAAQFWVRTQLQLATAVTVSAVLIYLGLSDSPKAIPPIAQIVAQNPISAIGLALVFLVVSVLAFVLARSRGPAAAAAQEGDVPIPASMGQAATPATAVASATASAPSAATPEPPSGALPAPPERPRAPRNRLALIGLLVLMIVSLALGGLGIGLVVNSANALRQEPVNVVNAFCSDLVQRRYTEAYELLSSPYQAKVSQPQFQQVSDLLDHVSTAVATCGASDGGAGADVGNTSAHVPTSLARLTGPQKFATITLARELNTWRIDNPEALQDTDVAALAVAANFCTNLTIRNYGEAYRLTSAGYQRDLVRSQ
jgi:type II secretory pathway pseudopilin PulG